MFCSICSALKKETSVAEQQYPRFNKLFKSDKNQEPGTFKKEKPTITGESKLMYGSKYF